MKNEVRIRFTVAIIGTVVCYMYLWRILLYEELRIVHLIISALMVLIMAFLANYFYKKMRLLEAKDLINKYKDKE